MSRIVNDLSNENHLNFKLLGESPGKTASIWKDFCKNIPFYDHTTKVSLEIKGYINVELSEKKKREK